MRRIVRLPGIADCRSWARSPEASAAFTIASGGVRQKGFGAEKSVERRAVLRPFRFSSQARRPVSSVARERRI
jgi:hypothetical protein